MNADNLPLAMTRPDLARIPQHALPEGFTLRWYRPGDEATWLTIQRHAETFEQIHDGAFAQQFGHDEAELGQRQAFLCDAQGRAIGTATAWCDELSTGDAPHPLGRVHWVAIEPAYQGRGLSRPLLTAVCNRLRDLGHRRAYLHTSSARLAAIRLYLAFGFEPEASSPMELDAWTAVREAIDRLNRR